MIYNETSLGQILRRAYDNAPKNRQVAMVHLFGIKYANIILEKGISLLDIIKAAGINEPYKTELRKGMNLAGFVVVKEEISNKYFNEDE